MDNSGIMIKGLDADGMANSILNGNWRARCLHVDAALRNYFHNYLLNNGICPIFAV